MLVRVSDRPPYKKDREREHERRGHDQGKPKPLSPKAKIDLENDRRVDHPPLDQESSPKGRHASAVPLKSQPPSPTPRRREVTLTCCGGKWNERTRRGGPPLRPSPPERKAHGGTIWPPLP